MQIAIGQPLGAERGRGLPDRQQFGMRGRIAVAQRAVARLRHHLAVAHDHAADRHLAGRRRGAGLVQRHVHEGRHAVILRFIKAWMPGIKPPG